MSCKEGFGDDYIYILETKFDKISKCDPLTYSKQEKIRGLIAKGLFHWMKQDRRYKTKILNSEKYFKVLFQTNQRAETNKIHYS